MPQSSLANVIDLSEERKKRMPRKAKSKADEIDDLVDDLDELDDEDEELEDEDEDVEDDDEDEEDEDDDEDEDEDEDDPDEKPARKSKAKKSSAKKPAKALGFGTKDLADLAGVEQRKLRSFLRAKGYQPRDDREGRYEWKGPNDPEVKKILRDIAKSGADKENKAATAKVKSKKTTAKAAPKKRRTKA